MDGLWAEPVRPYRTLGVAEGADPRVPLFFGYFLLGKQKKVTCRQDGGRKTQGRESVIAKTPKTEPRTNTIPTQPSP